MRRFAACLLLLVATCVVPGCGGASGIKEGMPDPSEMPPPGFDPGGDAKPDMSGKGVALPKK
jgi:hypothetical protein